MKIKGIVINKIQGFYYVKVDEQVYECKLRGILKRKDDKQNCVVGDIVETVSYTHLTLPTIRLV